MNKELKHLIVNYTGTVKPGTKYQFITSNGLKFLVDYDKLDETKKRILNETNVKNDIMSIIGESNEEK